VVTNLQLKRKSPFGFWLRLSIQRLTPQIVRLPGIAVLVDHHILVKLEGRESDRHLGHNTGRDSSETLVEG